MNDYVCVLTGCLILRDWQIYNRLKFFVYVLVLCPPDQANHLIYLLRLSWTGLNPDRCPHRTLPLKHLFSEHLVYNRDRWRPQIIRWDKIPPSQDGYSHRFEIILRHTIECRQGSLVLRITFQVHLFIPAITRERRYRCLRRRFDPRNRSDSVQQLPFKFQPPLLRHAQSAEVEVSRQNPVLAKPRIGCQQSAKAAGEKKCPDQHHKRQRHLTNHQRSAQSEVRPVRGQPPA